MVITPSSHISYKVCAVGELGAGRHSWIDWIRAERGGYKTPMPFGTSISRIRLQGKVDSALIELKLFLWDVRAARWEDRDAIPVEYYNGSQGLLAFASATDGDLIKHIAKWHDRVYATAGAIPTVYVVTKADLLEQPAQSELEKKLRAELGKPVFLTSIRQQQFDPRSPLLQLGKELLEKTLRADGAGWSALEVTYCGV